MWPTLLIPASSTVAVHQLEPFFFLFQRGPKITSETFLLFSLPAAANCWPRTLEKTSAGHLWSVTLITISRCFSYRCPQIRTQCLDSCVWLLPCYSLRDWVPGMPLLRPDSNPLCFLLTNLYLIYTEGMLFFFFFPLITRANLWQKNNNCISIDSILYPSPVS